jgi:hypothetical protein
LFTSSFHFTTSNSQPKSISINQVFDINEITDVEIKNYWTDKTWHLSQMSLLKLKNILKKSTVLKNAVILKPGHLGIVFSFANKTKRYYYMYPEGIFNDSRDYYSKVNYPFSIELSERINWDKLK